MIVAVAMMRDEADVAGWVVEHLWGQGVDRIIVADNLSTDCTPDMLRILGVEVIDDPEPGYYQARKMTDLVHRAGVQGATWVVPFDADEVWLPVGHDTLADALKSCPDGVIVAEGWDHIAQPDRDDPAEPNPFKRIHWRRDHPQRLPKVAFSYHPDVRLHMGNHDVDHHPGQRMPLVCELRHFGYRSLEQLTRKVRNGAAAYAATDLHEMYGSHWRTLGAKSDAQLAQEWADLCTVGADLLVEDPALV